MLKIMVKESLIKLYKNILYLIQINVILKNLLYIYIYIYIYIYYEGYADNYFC